MLPKGLENALTSVTLSFVFERKSFNSVTFSFIFERNSEMKKR